MIADWSVAYCSACRTVRSSVGDFWALTMMFQGIPVEPTWYTV